MNYCPNPECKKAVPDSAQHCPHCGQSLTAKNIPATPFYIAGITFLTIAVILFVKTIQPNFGKGLMSNNITSTPIILSTSPQPTLTKRIATYTPISLAEPKPSATMANSGSCTEAPRPRIFINARVKVITTNDERLVLRSAPTINSSTELQRLNFGTELKVHDGPICVVDPDSKIQYWFWEVKVKPGGQMGWVAEGDRILYYLEVIR